MKVSIALFVAVTPPAADAVGFRDLFKKVSGNRSSSNADADVNPAAESSDLAAANAAPVDQSDRELYVSGCSVGSTIPAAAWHPTYSAGWSNGYCQKTVDCNSPPYSSEVACCKAAYAGQISGFCLSKLPNPPTTSPTDDSGMTAGGNGLYFPDYNTAWTIASCKTGIAPSGWPTYSSMFECCKGAYAGQVSGACLASLPSPPTTAPTTDDYTVGFWYPDYETSWAAAGCKNTRPLPYPNENDRPNYSTQLECCNAMYAGQMSRTCLKQLPGGDPGASGGAGQGGVDNTGYYYPDYKTAWSTATCKNDWPRPFSPGSRPTYATMFECCKNAYAGQTSGACLAQLPSPPTTSPTMSGGLQVFYPDYNLAWPQGKCVNTRPMPSGRPTYSSKSLCCGGAYGGQVSHKCMCDAVGVCYSCKCGTDAERTAAGCTLTCN